MPFSFGALTEGLARAAAANRQGQTEGAQLKEQNSYDALRRALVERQIAAQDRAAEPEDPYRVNVGGVSGTAPTLEEALTMRDQMGVPEEPEEPSRPRFGVTGSGGLTATGFDNEDDARAFAGRVTQSAPLERDPGFRERRSTFTRRFRDPATELEQSILNKLAEGVSPDAVIRSVKMQIIRGELPPGSDIEAANFLNSSPAEDDFR